nr:MAG TPA: hypothetical protein [Caudoviricetes sp.]
MIKYLPNSKLSTLLKMLIFQYIYYIFYIFR